MAEAARSRVFISYRHGDRPMSAGRIYDVLSRNLGEGQVFMDDSDICLGRRWVSVIKSHLDSAEIVLAIIGPDWLRLMREKRLDLDTDIFQLGPDVDYVAVELSHGVRKRIPVIPVLVDGAELPKVMDLPDPLRFIPELQAQSVGFTSFSGDCEKLVKGMQLDRPRRKGWFG